MLVVCGLDLEIKSIIEAADFSGLDEAVLVCKLYKIGFVHKSLTLQITGANGAQRNLYPS